MNREANIDKYNTFVSGTKMQKDQWIIRGLKEGMKQRCGRSEVAFPGLGHAEEFVSLKSANLSHDGRSDKGNG